MVEQLMPQRGGFIKPFGCGWFIRECLLGHGPEGAPIINPNVGACQADLFYYYKIALHRAYAQAAVDYENEQRVKQRKPIYTEQEYRERVDYLMRALISLGIAKSTRSLASVVTVTQVPRVSRT